MNVQWGRYAEAYKAIHDAVMGHITSTRKPVTRIDFGWSGNQLQTLEFYNDSELLFTLTFTWTGNNLTRIERS